jgi:hypothetical protein
MAIIVNKLPIPSNEKGVAGGVATLDPNTGYIPLSQIDPSIGGQGDVLSVNNIDPDGAGNVDITTTDIPEGDNLYYSQSKFNTAFTSAIIPTTESISDLNDSLQSEASTRSGADAALSGRISVLEDDHVSLAMYGDHESRIDTLETDLPIEIQARIDDVADLQDQITAELAAREAADVALDLRIDDVETHHLHSNSYYANDGISDIQTEIDNVGTSQGKVVFVTSGSFGGSTVTFTNKVNLALVAPDVGNTITELASGRAMTIDGTSERIRVANLQVEGALTISGTKGRHIFSDCEFLGGVSIDGTTDTTATFITFDSCEFSNQNINIANLTNCTVYFNGCTFTNRRIIPTNVTSPTLIIVTECVGLNSLQTNLTSGVVLVGRTGYNDGTVKMFSSTSDYVNLGTGVITTFSGSYTELTNKPTLVTAASQLSDYNTLLLTSMKGAANGVAELDANGLIPADHLPPLALSTPYVVETIAERDALTGIETGDIAIVTDDTTPANNGNYIYDTESTTWIKLYSAESPVVSVNGLVGSLTLVTGDIEEGIGAGSEPSNLWFTDSRALNASVTTDIDHVSKAPSAATVKSYVTGITDALDTRLDSVETDALTYATITYVNNALAGKVNTTDYTAEDVLAKLLTVDGASSGLNADLLDGLDSNEFVQISGTQTITGDKYFSGVVTIDPPEYGDDSNRAATTAYVQEAISGFTPLTDIRTAVGLDSNDTWSLPTAHYIAGASVITGALSTLDDQLYSTNNVNSAQNTAVGLANDGTKSNFSSTYYVAGNSSFKAAIEALDAGLNTVAGNTPTINNLSDISNVNVAENLGDDGKYLKWDNGTSKWVASTVTIPAGYTDNDAKDTVGAMLEAGTGDVTFTYDEVTRTISTVVSVSGGINSVNGDSGPDVVLDAGEIESNYVPTNYTAGTTKIKGHLSGIDSKFATTANVNNANTWSNAQSYSAGYDLPSNDDSKKFATTAWVLDKVGSISGALSYKGTYNANTASPSLTTAVIGDVYAVSTAGSLASYPLTVGDLIIFKEDVTGGTVAQNDFNVVHQEVAVSSVQGLTGAVVIDGDNLESNYVPVGYTAANNFLDSHLAGISSSLVNKIGASSDNTLSGSNTITGNFTTTSTNNMYLASSTSVTVPTAGIDYATADTKAVNRTYLTNYAASQLLLKSNNLSELSSSPSTARTNLGLGTVATYNVGSGNNTIPVLGASGLPAVGGSSLTSLPGIDTLSDVTISSATSGQILSYNGTAWVNSAAAASPMSRATVVTITGNTNTPSAVSSGVIEVLYVCTSTSGITLDLTNIPANGNAGLKLVIKKTGAGAGQIIPKSGETIDGSSTGTDLVFQYSSITLISGGSTIWHVI